MVLCSFVLAQKKSSRLIPRKPLEKGVAANRLEKNFHMAKRVRGWQLEKELQRPKKSLEKATKKSALATALLCLWSHGKVSGCTIQMLAEDAILDGAQHEELHQIAKAGSHGVHPGSIHRDQMVSFCTGLDIPDPIDIWVPCKNPKSLKKDVEAASCFLPHQMFAKLANFDAFERNLST